jgi:hypothetical protein
MLWTNNTNFRLIYSFLHPIMTLMAPPAPVLAVSNALTDSSRSNLWVINGLTSISPDETCKNFVVYKFNQDCLFFDLYDERISRYLSIEQYLYSYLGPMTFTKTTISVTTPNRAIKYFKLVVAIMLFTHEFAYF